MERLIDDKIVLTNVFEKSIDMIVSEVLEIVLSGERGTLTSAARDLQLGLILMYP